jgi:hypothetical protein
LPKVMSLECCVLIKTWIKPKCSVTSVSETLCLKVWTIFYVQFKKHTGIHHTKAVMLVRAKHSYKGTVTPVSAFIDDKLMVKTRLFWPT